MILPHRSRIRIDSKKKKGCLILAIGEINGIPVARLAWSCVNSPTVGLLHRCAEVAKSKGERWAEVEKGESQNRGKKLLPPAYLKKNRNVHFASSESSNLHGQLDKESLIWGFGF
jgi:hypothetical protein